MFPLGNVLFPHAQLPLHVFEPRYRALAETCLAGDGEFGVVLIERGSEVGGGDTRFSIGTVARIVAEKGALPEAQAVMVVQMAKSQNMLFGGTEDFLVAREFARVASYDQKLALLECLFIVSAIDHTITLTEDQEIAKVALELKIEHADVVRARLPRREYLSVLRRPAED